MIRIRTIMLSGLLASAVFTAACKPAIKAPEAEPASDETAAADVSKAIDFAMPFKVKVNLSPAAAAKLAETDERVVVDAMYFAQPKDIEAHTATNPSHPGVIVGQEILTIEGADMVMPVPGLFDNAAAAEQTTGAVYALVNVYSARLSHADNILSCGVVEETLESLSEMPNGLTIDCKLIEE
jgi:hypothetical protein